jgi:hypothetical protein
MATIEDDSMLLGLPMELLQRTTDYLPDEVLTAIRLTCKTLETATLDRFIKRYCRRRHCFILSAARWTEVQTQFKQSPRLTSNVRALVLVTDSYECTGPTALQLAPEKHFDSMVDAQRSTYDHMRSNEVLSSWLTEKPRPDLATMIDVLSQVQQASPRVTAVLGTEIPMGKYAACRDVVTAIASTKIKLRGLKTSHFFTSTSKFRVRGTNRIFWTAQLHSHLSALVFSIFESRIVCVLRRSSGAN